MSIIKADISDVNSVMEITRTTISEIYPHYYPCGAVDFFLNHHCLENIQKDIESGLVYLCVDNEQIAVGTVTIKKNEICRLFVLPEYQGNGYGTELLDFAENIFLKGYSEIKLDASLPAKNLYINRGYEEVEYNIIDTGKDDFLCYDVMIKSI